MASIFVGTEKGAFIFRSTDRRDWSIEGPLFKGWKVTAFARDSAGNYLAGTASFVYGAAIQRSRDLKTWQQARQSPAYAADSGRKLEQVWRLVALPGACYAGVAEAGLFRSEDGGDTWSPVASLNDHATRPAWSPGAGGLCLHTVLSDPADPRRLWVGISAVGALRSDDGGGSWKFCNQGVRCMLEDKNHPEIGYCVHAMQADPASANRIWRQDHAGMYRSRDGGDSWEKIETGLSSGFGFPLGLDRHAGTLFAVPLESDEYRLPRDGRLSVYRSTDGGESWSDGSRGLPESHYYGGVLRTALDVDAHSPAGVYFGTTAGDLFFSADGGASWRHQPCRLPRVLCVSAFEE
jgi:photosystem II stability/assembly factor-like uncharacterized protein